nr:ammonia-forming cytochrome c nitrite reductase subunit c552 [Methanolobus bombayensis]
MESQELCASCHSSKNSAAESGYIIADGPQWEMYSGSIYTNGVHSINLECIDCHMATITYEPGEQKLVTGHSFNFDPALLSNPNSGNSCKKCHVTGHDELPETGDCDDCHDVSLSNITTNRQELTSSRLQQLEILRKNASKMLSPSDYNDSQQQMTEEYKEAVSYIEFVKADGSLGMHNEERTEEYLEKAEILLRSITGEESTDTIIEKTEIAGKEEQNENTMPDIGFIISFLIISVTAIVVIISKKKR